MTLPPEVAAKMFKEFSPEDVQHITSEISRLPTVAPALREQILADFCASLGIAPARLQEAANEEPALIAKALTLLSRLPPAVPA